MIGKSDDGGSALPPALSVAYDQAFGIKLYQGYGQTETTPVTAIYTWKHELAQSLSPEEKIKHRAKSGLLVPGVAGVTKETILNGLQGKVAKWWLPDDVVFVQEIPRTSVGKFSKRILRDMYQRGELVAQTKEQSE